MEEDNLEEQVRVADREKPTLPSRRPCLLVKYLPGITTGRHRPYPNPKWHRAEQVFFFFISPAGIASNQMVRCNGTPMGWRGVTAQICFRGTRTVHMRHSVADGQCICLSQCHSSDRPFCAARLHCLAVLHLIKLYSNVGRRTCPKFPKGW
jgi:hypothetical protein